MNIFSVVKLSYDISKMNKNDSISACKVHSYQGYKNDILSGPLLSRQFHLVAGDAFVHFKAIRM